MRRCLEVASKLSVLAVDREHMELEKLLHGSYVDWQGLDAGLSLDHLEKELQPVTAKRGPEEQQRTDQRFRVTHYSRLISPHEVDAWCAVGQEVVNILEYAEPPVTDLEGTLAQYGPPERMLADQRFAIGMRVWDYVYASRGITFSIGEPYAPAPPSPRIAVFIQLYAATSLQSYVTEVGSGVTTEPNVWPE